jgi:hypothetical protein
MRLHQLTRRFILGTGSIPPREVFVILNENPAFLGKHPPHPAEPCRWGRLHYFPVHHSTRQQNIMKSKAKNRKHQAPLVIPLTKRNFSLWFPLVAMTSNKLPLKARSTSLELCLRLV